MTLRLRILLGYSLLVAVSFSFIMYLIISEVRPRYLESIEEMGVDTAELVAAMLAAEIKDDQLDLDTINQAMAALSTRSLSARIYAAKKEDVNLRVYVTDPKGILLYDSTGESAPGMDFSRWRDVYLALRGKYGARSTRRNPEDPASSILYIAAPIQKNGKLYGIATVGKPQDSVSFFISIAKKRLITTISLIGCTALLLAFIFSRWITVPIKRLTGYVRSVQKGDRVTLPPLGSSEVGLLGAAISEMQKQLEGKEYIEDYVRALTHEMKSPLTGIKGAGEILRDHVKDPVAMRFLANIETEADRLQSLVERMLKLSRLENAKHIHKTPTALQTLFEELEDSFQPQLSQQNIRLEVQLAPGCTCMADAFLLRQAFSNIIANSLDFSPAGSVIDIRAAEKNGLLIIRFRDYGSGMPEFALHKAFDKFFSLNRPGTGKKSSGLGLPFVKEVLNQHGGSVSLANMHPGLEVCVRLPLQ